MKKLLFAVAVAILVIPMYRPLYGQDGGFGGGFGADSIDLSGLLGGNAGGNNRGGRGNNNVQMPTSEGLLTSIKDTLKSGKTPLEKAQEKPLTSLLNKEVTELSDRIQLLRNNNSNNNNGFPNNQEQQPQGRGGGRGGNGQQANNQQNNQPQQPSETAIKVETVTSLSNDDFIQNKLTLFLTPEQVALVKKAHADDKNNSNCLGGLFDRYYNQLQNPNRGNANRGNNNNANFPNNNNNNNNNAKRPSGLAYCMTMEATPSDRLEPIRKVLSKGNLPLAKDKESIAEIVMKSQLQDLEASLRAGLTTNNNNGGGRGNQNNNNQNRNNDPRQIINSFNDTIYKKVEATLNPPQAETLKKWHYEQMLGRGGIESLIAIEAMQDTPLSDEQMAKVTAAWPELRSQIQQVAKAAGKSITDKQRDSAAMEKILGMLEPSQEASYRLALKYGPQAAAGR